MIIIKSKESGQELEEKLLALLKREQICAEQFSFSSQCRLTFPTLTIDGRSQQVFQNGRNIALTRIESDLLLFLACNAGTIFSKEELFRAVWGRDSENTVKVVANTISNLRRKIGDGGSGMHWIRTVPGGYVFVPQTSESFMDTGL